MKLTSLSAFEKYLQKTAKEQLPLVYLFVSQDDQERREMVERVATLSGIERKLVLDGATLSVAQLGDELNSLSLLGERRIVHCRAVDQLDASCQGVLRDYCGKPNPAVLLLLEGRALKGKWLAQVDLVVDCTATPPWEKEKQLVRWVQDRAQKASKWLAPAACQQLIERVGPEMGELRSELEKLVCFVGEREAITLEDVKAVVFGRPAQRGWELGQAVLERKPERAVRILSGLLEQGEVSVHALLAQLRTQAGMAYQLCSLHQRGATPVEMGHLFPKLKGRRLARELERAVRFGANGCRQAILQLAEADRISKSQSIDLEGYLEQLVVRLAACR